MPRPLESAVYLPSNCTERAEKDTWSPLVVQRPAGPLTKTIGQNFAGRTGGAGFRIPIQGWSAESLIIKGDRQESKPRGQPLPNFA
jgi:hypothetical protein